MRILEFRTLRGTNIFHHKPVLMIKIDLESLAEVSSRELQGFNQHLLEFLPGLNRHHCSPGYEGGFVERLERGTYLGHIIEHIAIELSGPAGIEVDFGKTVFAGKPGHYNVVVRFKNEDAMKYLLRESVLVAQAAITGSSINLDQIIYRTREIVNETRLGPSSMAIVQAAEKRGIPWRRIGRGSLIQLGYGKYSKRIQAAVTDQTSLIAADLVQDKDATKNILKDALINVPAGVVVSNEEQAAAAIAQLRQPLVVKPCDGHHGQGITMNLTVPDQIIRACRAAWKYSSQAIIEEQCMGRDYRILVVDGKFTAAAERIPAHVVGDGTSTITELVEITNRDSRRGDGHDNILTKINLDHEAINFLSQQNLTAADKPGLGQIAYLRQTANLSTGGTARDVTDEVHPSIRRLSERVARLVGLDICGIDLIHDDIYNPVNHSTAVIEVNACPGLRMHLAPSEGKPREVGDAIIEMLYPANSPSRIPIVSVTGTNGKTTVARLVAHICASNINPSPESTIRTSVGLACSDGISIDGHRIEEGDTTGPQSARIVLSDPSVDVAVLETARGGLWRNGLGYDWSDVGVITNIRPDHIGQDGIENVEDLVRVKSIVAERVRDGGTVVLNADDLEASKIMHSRFMQQNRTHLVLFSVHADNPLIEDHLTRGGTVFSFINGWLCELNGSECRYIVSSHDLSFTCNGTSIHNLSNALAATAAARAIDVSHKQIAFNLKSFRANLHNSGRANIYRVRDGYVVLDYGHNPDAIEAVGKMVRAWSPAKVTGVIGLPGDRADELLEACAQKAGEAFDSLILRDDLDLRGRVPGETPKLVKNVVAREFPDRELKTILDTKSAIEIALSSLRKDEVVVIFYDEFEIAASALRSFDPEPIDDVPFLGSLVQTCPVILRRLHQSSFIHSTEF